MLSLPERHYCEGRPGHRGPYCPGSKVLREMREAAASSADSIQHFEAAFRPTPHVIESQILPKISKKVTARAEQIAATLPALPLVE
jgi:hypothetical protein